ncbi:LOW QUALITY PROTEIN: hypothetical protein V2J09_001805 [Rumex salicifolius]
MFGHYVTIKSWCPSFDLLTDVIATTQGRIRFTNLPIILYEEQVLLHLASEIGAPIKVDKKTLFANRGRFARVCVELDLSKPLKGDVFINGDPFMYEGLHSICFHCGKFGHFQPNCLVEPSNVAKREASKVAILEKGKETRKEKAVEDKFSGRSGETTKHQAVVDQNSRDELPLSSRFVGLGVQTGKAREDGVSTQPRMEEESQKHQKNKAKTVVVLEKKKQQKETRPKGNLTATDKIEEEMLQGVDENGSNPQVL